MMPSTCSTETLFWNYAEQFTCISVFKTSFSRLNPIPRGQATVIQPSVRCSPKGRQTTTAQSDKLPSTLQSLHHFQPARPSMVSQELGSDALSLNSKHLEASRSIFSSQYMQNRHQAEADANFLLLQRICQPLSRHQSELVELSGIEPLTPCLQSRCSPS
jgi:hypothetical protein